MFDVSVTPASYSPAWFRSLASARLASGAPTDVASVRQDSRGVGSGDLFVAIPGLTVDGNAYIERAIAAGAIAIVVQEDRLAKWQPLIRDDIPFVAVPDARIALAQAAAAVAGHPARMLGMIGVTGTDGKTTTTHLIAHVLNATGHAAGHLSSVEFGAPGAVELNASHMTTLEADEVQRQLARILATGCQYAVVEASSIGLELHRIDECEFDVGVFTNLAADHLDYHGTMEAYGAAKALLFRMLDASLDKGFPKAAILNADDPASTSMRAASVAPMLSYGLHTEADVIARDITYADGATRLEIRSRAGGRATARTQLLGDYNVANCLAAVAVAVSQGITLDAAAAALESFPGVPGRMESIDAGQPFRVIVDIASTEQSMRNVLQQLRMVTQGRLLVVFGAAGERDRERRTGIARAVAAAADAAIITNEDPRSEDPDSILDEIGTALSACGFRREFRREPDRRSAIACAFSLAAAGDTVLLAGKGTEQSIVIGTTHHPWDERRVARELLGARASV